MSRYAHDLTTSLAKLGVDVHVVTLRPPGRPKYEEIDGVKVHRVAGGRETHFVTGLPLMARVARRVCREHHIDIVHGQIPHMPNLCLAKKWGLGARFIETIHVTLDLETVSLSMEDFRDLVFWEKWAVVLLPMAKVLERHVVRRADGLIGVSESVKKYAEESYGIEEIRVIYEGVSAEKFQADSEGRVLKRRLGIGDSPTILYVGRHCARKRLELLIYALSVLREGHRDVKLVIVGRGTKYTQRVGKLAQDLDVGKSVLFTGYVPEEDLPKYYAMCDVFALTSQQESLGLTVLEAMASSKPVVVPNVGGLPEVAEHDKSGFIFDDFNGLVDGISSILSDERLARRMGREGRRRVLKDFTCQRMARDTVGFYEETLGT